MRIASAAFLQQFEDIRKYRQAKGTPTDAEQDLLRAMLRLLAQVLIHG
jgi:hypothetical protein